MREPAVYPMLVYLAGPQDDVSQDQARGWREELAAGAPTGVSFFSPAHAYLAVNRASFPAVDAMNRQAIQMSHAVIANLSGPGMGFGTIREIEFATIHNKLVQVVGPIDHAMMTWDLTHAPDLDIALNNILEQVQQFREMRRQAHGVAVQIIPPPEDDDE